MARKCDSPHFFERGVILSDRFPGDVLHDVGDVGGLGTQFLHVEREMGAVHVRQPGHAEFYVDPRVSRFDRPHAPSHVRDRPFHLSRSIAEDGLPVAQSLGEVGDGLEANGRGGKFGTDIHFIQEIVISFPRVVVEIEIGHPYVRFGGL